MTFVTHLPPSGVRAWEPENGNSSDSFALHISKKEETRRRKNGKVGSLKADWKCLLKWKFSFFAELEKWAEREKNKLKLWWLRKRTLDRGEILKWDAIQTPFQAHHDVLWNKQWEKTIFNEIVIDKTEQNHSKEKGKTIISQSYGAAFITADFVSIDLKPYSNLCSPIQLLERPLLIADGKKGKIKIFHLTECAELG